MGTDKVQDLLIDLVQMIDATEGVIEVEPDVFAPMESKEWPDLGMLYMDACKALDREPTVKRVPKSAVASFHKAIGYKRDFLLAVEDVASEVGLRSDDDYLEESVDTFVGRLINREDVDDSRIYKALLTLLNDEND